MKTKIRRFFLDNFGLKIAIVILGLAATGIGNWAYKKFVDKPVSIFTGLGQSVETISKLETSFSNHMIREKEFREKQSAKIDDLDKRLREMEILTAYLRGKSQGPR